MGFTTAGAARPPDGTGRVACVCTTSGEAAGGAGDVAARLSAAGRSGPVKEPGEGGGSAGSETGGVHVTAGAESPAGGPAGGTGPSTTGDTETPPKDGAERA